jgi:hypothetical protein
MILNLQQESVVLETLGTYFIAGIGLAIVMASVYLLNKLKERYKWVQKLTDNLMNKLFYNSVLRFFIQSYLKMSESAFTGIS